MAKVIPMGRKQVRWNLSLKSRIPKIVIVVGVLFLGFLTTVVLTADKIQIQYQGTTTRPVEGDTNNRIISDDNLPPIVQLSPGINKYVLVKATTGKPRRTSPDEKRILWFVKSATPEECGGKYHRYVAKELVKQLRALGFEVDVTGGGRIQYDSSGPNQGEALVYGYSNRYGKGDHVKTARLISKYTDIKASYNLSDSLY